MQNMTSAMSNKQQNKIAVPSKTSIKNAGSVFRSIARGELVSEGALTAARENLSQWRALHFYPINTFQTTIRQWSKEIDSHAIVAQRLKRMPSIIAKICRFPNMPLHKMQDIGGIRVVLNSIEQVYELHNKAIYSERFEHEAQLPPDNYITEPKPDGYRSLHQVFNYVSKQHPELNGLRIELQLRTRLQHAWATAVETLGIVEKASFKTGEGSETFKTFFKLCSALFALEEGQAVQAEYQEVPRPELVSRLIAIEQELAVISKLQGLAISARHIEKEYNKKAGYHVMMLDTERELVTLTPFPKSQPDNAELFYATKEQKTRDNPNISVVLISAGSVSDIKKAYPNYFLDTNDFVRRLKRIMAV